MNTDILVIIVGILSLIIGIVIGIQFFKYNEKKQNKKLLENAQDVLDGKRENKIKIDGEEFDATMFRVRDKDDNEILIDLQGGGEVQDGTGNKGSTRVEEISEQEVEVNGEVDEGSGENSGGVGEEKRTTGIRSILSRIRRFG